MRSKDWTGVGNVGALLFLVLALTLVLGSLGVSVRPQQRSMPQPATPFELAQQKLKAEAVSAQYNLGWYGNWCGGGHGGYQDCCNGTACKSCNTTARNNCNAGKTENWQDCAPTRECFKECPPVDDMDWACAYHDSCCIRNRLPPSIPSCYPEGNYCWCDCNLVSNVRQVKCDTWECWSFQGLIIQAFEYTLACWAYPPGNWSGAPYCDGVINRKQPIAQFCNSTYA